MASQVQIGGLNQILRVIAGFGGCGFRGFGTELSQYQSLSTGETSSIVPETMANEAPIIRLVNTIISGAVKPMLVIFTFEDEIKVRYRIDGVLQETPPAKEPLYSGYLQNQINGRHGSYRTAHPPGWQNSYQNQQPGFRFVGGGIFFGENLKASSGLFQPKLVLWGLINNTGAVVGNDSATT